MPMDAEMSNREVILDGPRLSLTLIAMIVPFYFLGDRLFHYIWENRTPVFQFTLDWWFQAMVILLAVILHELIHGILFAIYSPNGFKSVTFGINVKLGAFYCHCSDPLKVKQYRRAGIAPLVLLGIVPYVFALFTGITWIKTFGLLLTIGGFGDLLIYIKLLKFDSNLVIRDHPEKLGFIIEETSSS